MVEITKAEADELADFVVDAIYDAEIFNVKKVVVLGAIKDFLQAQHNNKYWYNKHD